VDSLVRAVIRCYRCWSKAESLSQELERALLSWLREAKSKLGTNPAWPKIERALIQQVRAEEYWIMRSAPLVGYRSVLVEEEGIDVIAPTAQIIAEREGERRLHLSTETVVTYSATSGKPTVGEMGARSSLVRGEPLSFSQRVIETSLHEERDMSLSHQEMSELLPEPKGEVPVCQPEEVMETPVKHGRGRGWMLTAACLGLDRKAMDKVPGHASAKDLPQWVEQACKTTAVDKLPESEMSLDSAYLCSEETGLKEAVVNVSLEGRSAPPVANLRLPRTLGKALNGQRLRGTWN